MSTVRRALAPLRRGQDGLTLIELLLAAMLGLIVVGGAMTVFLGAVRSEPRTAAKVEAIQDARVAVDRITRELRQGQSVVTAEPDQLVLVTYVKAASCGGAAASTSIVCQVTYSCSGDTCTRSVADTGGLEPGPAVEVASGLASTDVFEYDSESGYVAVALELEGDEGRTVSLEDGVFLRNLEEEEA